MVHTERSKYLEKGALAAACVIGISVCLLALVVAFGWMLDIPFLTRLWSTNATMKPTTLTGLLLGGTALTLLARPDAGARAVRIGYAASGLMLVVSALMLAMKAQGWGSDPGTGAPPLLLNASWATGVSIGLGAIMLLTLRSTSAWGRRIGRAATLLVGLITSVAIMAYLLGVTDLYSVEPYRSMALHTAAGLFALSVGACLAQPQRGAVALLLGDDAGGAVARRLLPAVVGATLIVAVGSAMAEQAGLWSPRLGLGVVVVLVVVGGVFAVAHTAVSLSAADRARQETERRNRVMLAELDHRVKNTMAAVLSLCEQTAAGCGTIDEFKLRYRGRLQAMARAHDALAASKWQGVSLCGIASTILGAYAFLDGRTLEIEGDDLVLPGSAALPIAFTLNELATNAVKHGAWSNPATMGSVRVSWRVTDTDRLDIDWAESGGPTPVKLPNGGFGLSLIRGMIPHEMRGTVELAAEPLGLACHVRLSLNEAMQTTATKFAMAG